MGSFDRMGLQSGCPPSLVAPALVLIIKENVKMLTPKAIYCTGTPSMYCNP